MTFAALLLIMGPLLSTQQNITRAQSSGQILVDATHMEVAVHIHSQLRQLLIDNGYSIDVHYVSDIVIIQETPFQLQPGSSFSTPFTLTQKVPVLVLQPARNWTDRVAFISVTDPAGKTVMSGFWASPYSIDLYDPLTGTWTITIKPFRLTTKTQSNTLIIGTLSSDPLTSDLLGHYQYLMLDDPFLSFDSREINAIIQFVRDGGGLLVNGGDPNDNLESYGISPNNINDLVRPFGIQFTGNYVTDSTSNFENTENWPFVTKFASHQVVQGVTQLVGGQQLDVQSPAEPVAFSASSSSPANIAIIAVAKYGNGKTVAIGDSYMLGDGDIFTKIPDCRTLALNILRWLAPTYHTTQTLLTNSVIQTSTISRPSVDLALVIPIFLVAVFVLVPVYAVVSSKRRKKKRKN